MNEDDEKAAKKKERKFSILPQEWRDQMMGSDRSDVEIDSEIKKAAVSLVSLELAKALDEDLIALQEQLQVARAVYTDGKKENLIRIEFLIDVLRSRGRDVPSVQSYIKSAKEE